MAEPTMPTLNEIQNLKSKLDEAAVESAFEGTKSPVDHVELPMGYFDAEEGVVYNQAVLSEITGVEEDMLTSRSIPMIQRINMVLANCVKSLSSGTGKVISGQAEIFKIVRHLPIADRTFITFALRRISLGDDFAFSVDCESCSNKLKKVVNLKDLEVEQAPEPEKRVYDLKLPSGKTARWKVGDGIGEEKMSKLILSRQDKDMMTRSIETRMVELDGKPCSYGQIRALTLRDRNALRQDFDAKEGGIDASVGVACEHCGTLFDAIVGIGTEGFFFPARN